MKILKPHWLNHDGMAICTVDIHPDDSRIATGGQGSNSGRITIWNMAPFLSEEKENNTNVPKMLCQMDNHLACVNCVRWSSSGKFLASGGDDKLIMIWTISKCFGGNMVFGSKGKVNVEGWRCAHTLRSHQGDVLDMAWSPGDHWLATCSIDNTIIVWKADSFPEVVTVLKGHTGLVKGVSWDPIGKYLGSQSDDKTVRIWRTSDWCTEKIVKKPFERTTGTTMVLRLSWSPDGQALVTAHAMNGTGPTAQIIERDGWNHTIDFVGHVKAVTCSRYSPTISEVINHGKLTPACVCALGSRDCSISVWNAAKKRPVVVVREAFTSPVLDLAWSHSGMNLIACSGDGSAIFITFDENEIGRPITHDEKDRIFEKLYGKVLVGGSCDTVVVENPELLKKKDSPVKETVIMDGIHPATNGDLVNSVRTPTPISPIIHSNRSTKQIETRTSDGRRRITPIFIPLNQDTSDSIQPFGSDSMPSFSSCGTKSRIIVERREDVVVPPNVTPVKTVIQKSASNTPSKSSTQNTTLTSSPIEPQAPGAFTGLVEKAEKVDTKKSAAAKRAKPLAINSSPVKKKKKKLSKELPPQQKKLVLNDNLIPPLELTHANNIKLFKSRNYINIENGASKGPHGYLSIVRLYSPDDSRPLWEIILGSEICGCVGSSEAIALACADQTLRLIDPGRGHHLIPPVALVSRPSFLVQSSAHVLCITTSGHVTVWSTSKTSSLLKAVIADKSISSLIPSNGEIKIKECLVTESGEPVIALACGKAFLCSISHNCWLLVGNSNDPVLRNSQHNYRSFVKSSSSIESLPLKSVQTATLNGTNSSTRIGQSSDLGPMCTISFLDTQIASAKALESKSEYKFWLLTYVRFLVNQGLESRLRRICEDLLGPNSISVNSLHSSWNKQILGLNKHSLLRDVLKEMSSNLKLQRLYTEIIGQLDGPS